MRRLLALFVSLALLLVAHGALALQCDGLASHERAGGHVLARHVGKDAAFLRERVRRDRVSASSTFRSLPAAERFVREALDANRARIGTWSSATASRLVLSWRTREVTGLSVGRRARAPREVHGVRLVLQRDRRMDCGYHLVTAYPEAP